MKGFENALPPIQKVPTRRHWSLIPLNDAARAAAPAPAVQTDALTQKLQCVSDRRSLGLL